MKDHHDDPGTSRPGLGRGLINNVYLQSLDYRESEWEREKS